MTQTPESTEPPIATGQSRNLDRSDPPGRLGQLWAAVGIAAGVVFIVAVIFFSGFFLGRDTDGPYDSYGGYRASSGGRDATCPMMGSGGGMGPGMMGPGESMEPRQMATPTPQPMPHP